jgi:hypothetical protein
MVIRFDVRRVRILRSEGPQAGSHTGDLSTAQVAMGGGGFYNRNSSLRAVGTLRRTDGLLAL